MMIKTNLNLKRQGDHHMAEMKINNDEFKALAANPDNGPFVMLNLLKFRGKDGLASYESYSRGVVKILGEVGAQVLYLGRADELLMGDERWDAILLVRYPSRKSFLEMIMRPDYQEAHVHRETALERTVLYATTPVDALSKIM
jgi:uncharacterized protein (DUF1330 family)